MMKRLNKEWNAGLLGLDKLAVATLLALAIVIIASVRSWSISF